MKQSVGATDSERGRHGHTAVETEDPIKRYFPDGGYMVVNGNYFREPTRRMGGRPRTTIHDPGILRVYFMDVVNEATKEFQWVLELDGEDFGLALAALTAIIFARAKSANPRELEKWLPMSKSEIYRQRNRGKMLLNQLDRIEQQLKDNAAESRAQWEKLFTRLYHVDESEFVAPDYPETEGGTKP